MGQELDIEAVGGQIERLLDELRLAIIPREYDNVNEVVRLVTELYGAGLERIVSRLPPEAVGSLVDDRLVASLLLVHGLHPEDLESRLLGALASVRPVLQHHHGDVELLDIDADAGAVRLRLLGSCDGCPSSSVTLQNAVEAAITAAAPEIILIDVEAPTPEPEGIAVALGRKPDYERCPTDVLA